MLSAHSRGRLPRDGDVVQIAISAEIDVVIHQRSRGIEPIVKRVRRQHFERRTMPDDERRPVSSCNVDAILRGDR